MNYGRFNATYISLSSNNNGTDPTYDASTSAAGTVLAQLSESYRTPVFSEADKYVIAVERMEISTNAIPFYIASGETITVLQKVGGLLSENNVAQTSYSLTSLLGYLSTIDFVNPIDLSTFNIVFTLTKEGYVKLILPGGGVDFDTFYIEIPRILNMALGISTSTQTTGTICTSAFPRFDTGDAFQRLVLESNLQTVSDLIGQAPFQVLTDFAPPTIYQTSDGWDANENIIKQGVTVNIRQKLIYNPNEKRYLDLISPFGIQTIIIKAYYVDLDGNYRLVELPLGGVFNIKIGFYKKE